MGCARGAPGRFRASGLAHLLAVSGQNVRRDPSERSLVFWFVLGFSTLAGHAAAIAVVAAYVAAVGWEPSVIRAGVAGGLVSLAWLAAREGEITGTSWPFGALVLLVWHPKGVAGAGVPAVVRSRGRRSSCSYGRLVSCCGRVTRCLGAWAWQEVVIALTVSASLATAPIAYLHFGTLPIWTVPANIAGVRPAVPPFLLWFALAAGVLEPVLPGATVVLSRLAGLCAQPGSRLRPCVRVVAIRRGRVSRGVVGGWSVLCSRPWC